MPEVIHPYKKKLIDLANRIKEHQLLGYLMFKPLKKKEVRIKNFEVKDKVVEAVLETKYHEEYPVEIEHDKLEQFLEENFCYERQKIRIIAQVEKSITKKFGGVELGFTDEYEKFKVLKHYKQTNKNNLSNLIESFKYMGNIIPIFVIKKETINDKKEKDFVWLIIDGKTRYQYCKEINEDIFYMDISSMFKLPVNEKLVIDASIRLNGFRDNTRLKDCWSELCKYYYQYYKDFNSWMCEQKIEQYINKYHFILLLEPNLQIIYTGQANFDKKEEILDVIKYFYDCYSKDTDPILYKNGKITTIFKWTKDLLKNYGTIEEYIKQNVKGKEVYGVEVGETVLIGPDINKIIPISPNGVLKINSEISEEKLNEFKENFNNLSVGIENSSPTHLISVENQFFEEQQSLNRGKTNSFVSNTKVNLCETCKSSPATCISSIMEYGDGVGNDNVIKCDQYMSKYLCGNTGKDCENPKMVKENGLCYCDGVYLKRRLNDINKIVENDINDSFDDDDIEGI